MYFPHMDETKWPNKQFQELATSNFENLFDIGVDVLRAMGKHVTGSSDEFVSFLQNPGSDPSQFERKQNTNTNYSLFRYNDDEKKYQTTQKCMIHQDSGLITLLPRSTFPGLELYDVQGKHFIPIEKFTADNEVLVFCGQLMQRKTKLKLCNTCRNNRGLLSCRNS